MIRSLFTLSLGLGLGAGCGEVKTDAASGDDPTITMLTPDHGPILGGVMVTLSGTNLAGANPTVVVGGVAAKDATATNNNTLTFTLPPGTAGTVADVEVATDHGFAVKPAALRYNLQPIVLEISPKFGRFAGGTAVTITGRGFQVDEADIPTVTIGGSPATAVQIVDDKTITATTAASDPQALAFLPTDISVSNKNGTNTASKSFSLTKQGILLTSGQNNQQLAYLDPATKAVVPLGQTPNKMSGCAVAPTGKLLAQRAKDSNTHELVEFDPITREATKLGQFTDGASTRDFSSMAFVGNSLFVVSRQLGRFYSANPATAALTQIGATDPAFQIYGGITQKDGTSLWFLSSNGSGGTLSTVNTTTGAITAPLTLTGAGGYLRGLVVVGGVLYVSSWNSNPTTVYKVNTTTGALTQFASVSIPSASGMCTTPPAF